jgi:hypothetical protein
VRALLGMLPTYHCLDVAASARVLLETNQMLVAEV